MDPENQVSSDEVKNLRTSKEIESHLRWLDTFTSAALGILAVASGITPENVAEYKKNVDLFMVATGINIEGDFYNIDANKLKKLMYAIKH